MHTKKTHALKHTNTHAYKILNQTIIVNTFFSFLLQFTQENKQAKSPSRIVIHIHVDIMLHNVCNDIAIIITITTTHAHTRHTRVCVGAVCVESNHLASVC